MSNYSDEALTVEAASKVNLGGARAARYLLTIDSEELRALVYSAGSIYAARTGRREADGVRFMVDRVNHGTWTAEQLREWIAANR